MQLRRLNISPIQQAAGRLSNRSYTAEGIERASQTISNEIRRRREERYQRKMQFLKDVQLDIDDANMQLLGESVDNFYEKATDIYQSSDGDIPLDGHMEIKRMMRGINDREAQVNSLKQQYANEMQLAAKHPDQFTISQERLQEDLNKIAKGEAVATTPDPYTGKRYVSFEPIEDLESFLSGSIPAYIEWEPEVQTGKGVQTVNGAQYATNKATYGKNSGLFLRNFLQENPRLAYSAELSMQREGVKDKTPAQYLNEKYGGMFGFTSEKPTSTRIDRASDGSGSGKTAEEKLGWAKRTDVTLTGGKKVSEAYRPLKQSRAEIPVSLLKPIAGVSDNKEITSFIESEGDQLVRANIEAIAPDGTVEIKAEIPKFGAKAVLTEEEYEELSDDRKADYKPQLKMDTIEKTGFLGRKKTEKELKNQYVLDEEYPSEWKTFYSDIKDVMPRIQTPELRSVLEREGYFKVNEWDKYKRNNE